MAEVKMRSSLGLGIAGGIITFIMAGVEIVVGSFGQAFNLPMAGAFPALIIGSMIGGTLGIVGGAIGKIPGGVLMIVGGILALIGAGLFGILGLV
ncbi:MAG: hypothetical protein WCF23_20075, partial [Candidatus Nitrosopolaris sp.]